MTRSKLIALIALPTLVLLVFFAAISSWHWVVADTLPAENETIRLNLAAPGRASTAQMSSDGRYVAFSSDSSVLVTGDSNGLSDIFLRDLQNSSTQRLNLVNGSSNDQATGGNSYQPVISANGAVVAFLSSASNLTADSATAGRQHVFVRTIAGNQTLRINAQANAEPNGESILSLAISPDGEYVAFTSRATNLTSQTVTQTYNGSQILTHVYLWGPRSGSPTVKMVDVTPTNQTCLSPFTFFDTASHNPQVSEQGNYVVFTSACGDLVSPQLTNSYGHLYRRNMNSGAVELLSKQLSGDPAPFASFAQGISANGCYVLFSSIIDQFVSGDSNSKDDAFVWDCGSGSSNKITRASLAHDQSELTGTSSGVAISDDGRYVTFSSNAANASADDSNNNCDTNSDSIFSDNCSDFFVRDRTANTSQRVSLATGGTQLSQGTSFASGDMSNDGRYVLFLSQSPELGVPDASVFRHDRNNSTTIQVNLAQQTPQADGDSVQPIISSGQRYVAFASDADNLYGAGGSVRQIYVRDLTQSRYQMLSRINNNVGNGISENPAISGDSGNCIVAFESEATNLVISGTNGISDTNGVRDIYIKGCGSNDQPGYPQRVNNERSGFIGVIDKQMMAASRHPVISRNGAVVVFEADDTQIMGAPVGVAGTPQIYLADLDRLSSGKILIRISGSGDYSNGSNYHPAVSADGRCVAWSSDATNNRGFGNPSDKSVRRIYRAKVNLTQHTVDQVDLVAGLASSVNYDYPSLSADCRYLTYLIQAAPLSTTYQLWYHDYNDQWVPAAS